MIHLAKAGLLTLVGGNDVTTSVLFVFQAPSFNDFRARGRQQLSSPRQPSHPE